MRSKAKLAEAVSDRRVIARVEPINDDLVAALMQHGKADAPGELSLIDYVYFANYTITTTGYGDIVPVTAYAKFLCSAANICEVFFLVVFFNTLLSLRQPAGRKPPEDRQTGKQRAANAAKEDSTDEQDAARFGVGASIKAANASAQESATPPADSAPSVPAKAEDQFKETRRPRTTRKLRAKRNDERSGPAPP